MQQQQSCYTTSRKFPNKRPMHHKHKMQKGMGILPDHRWPIGVFVGHLYILAYNHSDSFNDDQPLMVVVYSYNLLVHTWTCWTVEDRTEDKELEEVGSHEILEATFMHGTGGDCCSFFFIHASSHNNLLINLLYEIRIDAAKESGVQFMQQQMDPTSCQLLQKLDAEMHFPVLQGPPLHMGNDTTKNCRRFYFVFDDDIYIGSRDGSGVKKKKSAVYRVLELRQSTEAAENGVVTDELWSLSCISDEALSDIAAGQNLELARLLHSLVQGISTDRKIFCADNKLFFFSTFTRGEEIDWAISFDARDKKFAVEHFALDDQQNINALQSLPRSNFSSRLAVHQSKLLWPSECHYTEHGVQIVSQNEFWQLDFASRKWSRRMALTPLEKPLAGYSSAISETGDVLYIYGGEFIDRTKNGEVLEVRMQPASLQQLAMNSLARMFPPHFWERAEEIRGTTENVFVPDYSKPREFAQFVQQKYYCHCDNLNKF